jgi:hypothetical protein
MCVSTMSFSAQYWPTERRRLTQEIRSERGPFSTAHTYTALAALTPYERELNLHHSFKRAAKRAGFHQICLPT